MIRTALALFVAGLAAQASADVPVALCAASLAAPSSGATGEMGRRAIRFLDGIESETVMDSLPQAGAVDLGPRFRSGDLRWRLTRPMPGAAAERAPVAQGQYGLRGGPDAPWRFLVFVGLEVPGGLLSPVAVGRMRDEAPVLIRFSAMDERERCLFDPALEAVRRIVPIDAPPPEGAGE